jgi:hypothetical protein
MAEALDLTGRWVGHYTQRDRPHGIEAELFHRGARLTGSMRDRETEFDHSVFEVAAEAGLPPGADEQIIARIREAVPDAAGAPIRYVSRLPEESYLVGWVKGPRVYWLKTYQGALLGGYRVGDRILGLEVPEHTVHYEGEVNRDGTLIEGRWWIDANPE